MTCTIISKGNEIQQSKNEYEPPYPKIKEQLRRKIWELYSSGYTDFYLNCEYGIPLWAAEIICEMKGDNNIGLHIVMPYENQAVKWVEGNKERFYNVHSLSDDVHMISTHYYDGCYDDADKYMIDRSDLLLVYGEAGGNLYGVRYAMAKGIQINY